VTDLRHARPGLSRGQQVELTAVGIGHDHDADISLAVTEARGPEGDQTAGLRSRARADICSPASIQVVIDASSSMKVSEGRT
jgi:hypothetical protein